MIANERCGIAIGVHEQLQVYLREARKRFGRIVRRDVLLFLTYLIYVNPTIFFVLDMK
jgi:hypothetical protein